MAAASWCRAPKRFGKMHGPPPGVLRDPHAAAARSQQRRSGAQCVPGDSEVPRREQRGPGSSGPQGFVRVWGRGWPWKKLTLVRRGDTARSHGGRRAKIERGAFTRPEGAQRGRALRRGRPSQGRPWRWRPWVIIKDPMRIPMMVTRRSPRGSRLQKLLVPWSWGAPPPLLGCVCRPEAPLTPSRGVLMDQ